MYKVFTYLVVPLFCYLPVYMLNLLLIEWVTKMKPGSNSVEEPSLLGVGGGWGWISVVLTVFP